MNIFITDPDPKSAAENLDDRLLTQMILTYTQILSNAVRNRGIRTKYRPRYESDAVSAWVGASRENFIWLCQHISWLNYYYHHMSGKNHKSYIVAQSIFNYHLLFPPKAATPFINQTYYFENLSNTFRAYQKLLNVMWQKDIAVGRSVNWSKRAMPVWVDLDIDYPTHIVESDLSYFIEHG